MKKIPSLYVRGEDGKLTSELHPKALWVFAGEGLPTRKYDGTSCLVRGGVLYRRYDAKTALRKGKPVPENFEPCEAEPDPVTGHWPGWIPVVGDPSANWHRSAWEACGGLKDGTYELCGPKIQGNPEKLEERTFIPHGKHVLKLVPRNWDELNLWFQNFGVEGIVFHHPDGRMAKIKRRDFGLPWPV